MPLVPWQPLSQLSRRLGTERAAPQPPGERPESIRLVCGRDPLVVRTENGDMGP